MLALYSNILFLVAIFAVLAIAAIVGLWHYNAAPETDAVRPTVLSDEVRADHMRARNKIIQGAINAKKARKIAYGASLRASRMSVKKDDTAATGPAARQDGKPAADPPPPKTAGPATPS